MSLTTRKTALLAAILLCTPTMADDIQQVSCTPDHCGSAGCGSDGCTSEGCNTKAKHTRCQNCRNSKSQCRSCNACDSCDSCDSSAGKCSMRDRKNAFALDWSSKCGPIGRRAAKGRPLAKLVHWHCTTKAYPDSGWAPPQANPMTRASRSYTAYNNYGMGGYAPSAPMIYQPTDTTQQGYSYANVPQWQPNPNMIPPIPQPSHFHNRYCPSQQCGFAAGHNAYYEEVSGSCPSCHLTAIQQPVPQQQIAARTSIRATPAAQTTASKPFAAVTAPKPAPLQPVASKVRAITPPPIDMNMPNSNAKPQLKQVSQQSSVRPSNQTSRQRVRPSNNYRQAQQKQQAGWFGLPSLRDVKF